MDLQQNKNCFDKSYSPFKKRKMESKDEEVLIQHVLLNEKHSSTKNEKVSQNTMLKSSDFRADSFQAALSEINTRRSQASATKRSDDTPLCLKSHPHYPLVKNTKDNHHRSNTLTSSAGQLSAVLSATP